MNVIQIFCGLKLKNIYTVQGILNYILWLSSSTALSQNVTRALEWALMQYLNS